MSVLTRDNIKEQLEKIIKDYSYKGEILDILTALMTESVYLTTLNSGAVLREGSLLTALQTDSILALCHDNFTTVSRGYCQRLKLQDLYVATNQSVKAFDLLESKSANYKLYYAEDGNYDISQNNVSLTLIVGSDIVSYDNDGDVDTRLFSSSYILDIPEENLSEDFLLFKNDQLIYNVDNIPIAQRGDAKYVGYMYTTNAKYVNEAIPYYVCTVPPNYSVRIYGYYQFKESDKYTFKCIKHVKDNIGDISPTLLKSLQGFLYKDNIPNITNIASVAKDSSISHLKTKVVSNYRDRNYISSFNAIKEVITAKLSQYFVGFNLQIINGQMLITYALKDNSAWGAALETEFKNSIIFDYKVEEEIVFEKAKEQEVPLYLNIYYSNVLNELEINDLITQFETRVGGEYSIDELKAYLKVGNVLYVETIPDYDEIIAQSGTRVALETEEPVKDQAGMPVLNPDGSNVMKKVIKRLRFKPRDIRYISKTEQI